MKIRLYKGPFSGKVLEHRDAGRNTIIIRDHKKVSREKRYELEMEYFQNHHGAYPYPTPGHVLKRAIPLIEAEYRICNHSKPAYMQQNSNGFQVVTGVMMHPDGSLFYEWTGKKRELS